MYCPFLHSFLQQLQHLRNLLHCSVPFDFKQIACSSVQEAFYNPIPCEMNGIQVLKSTFSECRPETLYSLGTADWSLQDLRVWKGCMALPSK